MKHERGTASAVILALCGSILLHTGGTVAAFERPMPEDGGPTIVHTEVVVLDIDEIDSASQTVTLNFFVGLRWHDPRLARDGNAMEIRSLGDIWHPRLQIINQQKIWPTLPDEAQVNSDGTVIYGQRFWGPLSQPLNLRDFPFDEQEFEILLASSLFGPNELKFISDENQPSGIAGRLSLPDWDIVRWETDSSPYAAKDGMTPIAAYTFRIIADRQLGYYWLKVILPLILIVMMSWIVFWIDPTQSGSQIGVATSSMLTLIAYRFMIGEHIPSISYLTRLDEFILISTLLVFASLVMVIVTSRLAKSDRAARARQIDRVCRVAFPAAFVVAALVAALFG